MSASHPAKRRLPLRCGTSDASGSVAAPPVGTVCAATPESGLPSAPQNVTVRVPENAPRSSISETPPQPFSTVPSTMRTAVTPVASGSPLPSLKA